MKDHYVKYIKCKQINNNIAFCVPKLLIVFIVLDALCWKCLRIMYVRYQIPDSDSGVRMSINSPTPEERRAMKLTTKDPKMMMG